MSITLAFGVVAMILVISTLELVRRRLLKERYAAIWVGFTTLIALGVIFQGAVTKVAHSLGFEVPANLVIVAGVLALAFVSVVLSIEVTRLRGTIERVTNRLAVLEAEQHGSEAEVVIDE